MEIADLVAVLRADTAGFDASMLRADAELNRVHGSSVSATSAISTMALGLGVLGGVALGGAVKAAADFNTMIVRMQDNTTLTNAQVEVMRGQILQLAASSNVPLQQLTDGMMHISAFTFRGADAMNILKAAMMSASSTGGDTSKVAELLAAVMHEFSLSGKDAMNAMDVLHLAAAQGNMTLEQFVNVSGKAMAMAANLDVPLTDVAAAMAALTAHGIPAAQASTLVQGALSKILNPAASTTKELKAISDATGINLVYDFSRAGLQAKGLAGVLSDVALASQKANVNIFGLIPATRGGLAAMILTGTGAKDYRNIQLSLSDAMAGRVTPTADAYRRIQQTTAYQMGQLSNQVQVLGITIGSILLPPLTNLLAGITPILAAIVQWAQDNPALVDALVKGTAAFATLAIAIGAIGLIGDFLAPVVAVLTEPAVLAAILALGALVAGLKKGWDTNFLGIRDTLTNIVWPAVQPVLTDLKNAVGDLFLGFTTGDWGPFQTDLTNLKNDLGTLKDALGSAIAEIGSHFSWRGFQDFWNWLSTTFNSGKDWAAVHIPILLDDAGSIKDKIISWLKTNVPTGVEWATVHLGLLLDAVGNFKDQITSWLAANVPKGAEWLKIHIGMAVDFLGNLKDDITRWIRDNAPKAGSFIATTIQLTAKFVGNLAEIVGNWIKENAPKAGSAIAATVNLGIKIVGDLIGAVAAFIARYGPGVLHAVGAAVGIAVHLVGDLAKLIGDWVATNGPKALQAVSVPIKIALAKGADIAGEIWSQLSAIGGPLISTITKWVGDNAGKVGNAFDGFNRAAIDWVGALPVNIIKALSDPKTGIASNISSWVDQHKKDIQNAAGGLAYAAAYWAGEVGGKVFELLLDAAFGIPVRLTAAVVRVIPDLIKQLSDPNGRASLLRATTEWVGGVSVAISNALLGIGVGGAKGLLKSMEDTFNNIANDFASWIGVSSSGHPIDDLSSWAGQVPGKIAAWLTGHGSAQSIEGAVQGVFSDAGGWLVKAGQDIVNGLEQGISSMGGAFEHFIAVWLREHHLGMVADVLGISSPSKVMADIGVNVVKGLQLGIDSQANNMRGTVATLGKAIASVTGAAPNGGRSLGLSMAGKTGVVHNHIYMDGKQIATQVFNQAARDRRMRPELVS